MSAPRKPVYDVVFEWLVPITAILFVIFIAAQIFR